MKNDETAVVDTATIINHNVKNSLTKICNDLQERGYNPVKQIVAYLVSGDPGYISSYKECRNRILEFKIEDILEVMLVNFINK